MPGKNKSRLAGVTLNYQLTPRLDFDGTAGKVGDVFALLLFSRHREKAGLIDEIAIGVVDSGYTTFLFYEPLEEFLSGHGDAAPERPIPPTPPIPQPAVSGVRLKKSMKPFVPPEAPQPDEKEKSGK